MTLPASQPPPAGVAWIWSDRAADLPDQHAQFRIRFRAGRSARVVLFADSAFTVFCNGEPVGIGPDFGIARAPRLTALDLEGFLARDGDNLLAVQVFFEGARSDCCDISALKAGLIGWIEAEDVVIPTGPDWLARTVGGVTAPQVDGWRLFANHRLACLDLRGEPAGWLLPGDPPGWAPARIVAPHPDPQRPVLRRSPLPPQSMRVVVPAALLDAGRALAEEEVAVRTAEDVARRLAGCRLCSAIRPDSPVSPPWTSQGTTVRHLADPARARDLGLPARSGGRWSGLLPAGEGDGYLLFDLGAQVSGVVVMDLEPTGDCTLDLAYGEALERGRVDPLAMGHSYADRVVIGPGRRRVRLPHDRAFRYLHLSWSSPCLLHALHVEEHTLPHDEVERFRSGDPALNAIWAMARRTMHHNALTTLVDNARRERQGWGGPDLAAGNAAYAAVFGDLRLPAKKLGDFADAAEERGALPCWAPGNGAWIGQIPAHDLWFPAAARDHALHGGDLAFARRLLPIAERALDRPLCPVSGLIAGTGGWKWAEWSLRTSDPAGIDTWENLLAIQGWRAVADLRRWTGLGDPGDALARAAALATRTERHLWHPGHGALSQGTRADGALSDFCGQVDNALALSLGILHGERAAAAEAWCAGPSGTWPTNRSGWHGGAGGDRGCHDPGRVVPAGSPYASAICATTLFDLGRDRAAVEYIRQHFGAMVDEGDGTAWECWPVTIPGVHAQCRSQGFGASIAWVLVTRLCGLACVAPGGDRLRWAPRDLGYGALEASWRTRSGEVRVGYAAGAPAWMVPAGVQLEVVLPGQAPFMVDGPASQGAFAG
jgi:hypothetical protein